MNFKNIKVEIDSPIEDTTIAMIIIDKLLKINNIKMKISIAYDYSYEGCGMYLPNVEKQSHRIFVNPANCKTKEETEEVEYEDPFCPGYCSDMTLFGITIHEFCHLLQYQVYPDIIPEYGKAFPTERLYLNNYSNNELHDELAEVMTLYITNPYLLKLISKEHWLFCKRYFKSPVATSVARCKFIYQGFPIHVKEHLKEHWNIVFNVDTEKFERVE